MVTFIKLCDNQVNGRGTVINGSAVKKIREIFPAGQSDKYGHIIKRIYIMKDRHEITGTREEYTALVAEVASKRGITDGKAHLAVSFAKKGIRRDGLIHLSEPVKIISWEIS